MTLIAVMNGNGTLAHKAGSLISGGVFTITSVPSTKVFAEGAGVFSKEIKYTFSGGNSSGFDPGSISTTAPQTIPVTAMYVKVDGELVVREGDFGTMSATGTVSGTPTPIAGPVEVSDAGQTKVLGE